MVLIAPEASANALLAKVKEACSMGLSCPIVPASQQRTGFFIVIFQAAFCPLCE